MRVELPEGNWAELRDPADLYDEDRKAVSRHVVVEYNDEAKTRIMRGETEDAMADALLERIVEAWSYTHLRVPSKAPSSLGKLKISHARALRDALSPYFKVMNGTADDEENPIGSES